MSEKKILNLAIKQPLSPNDKVIQLLREALKDAKEGKVQAVGLALAITDTDPDSDNGRATETVLSASDGWYHSLTAAVNGLAFRLNYERYTQGATLPDSKLDESDE
jgi:hypothetical protein